MIPTYINGRTFFAQVAGGLEPYAVAEFESLGATAVRPAYRGVTFSATSEVLYRINYSSTLASRVLAPLVKFDCHSTKQLYSKVKGIAWEDWLTIQETFAISAITANSKINHSKFAALRVKDAIADRFRDRNAGKRPSVDRDRPDLRIHIHIHADKATLSVDCSGDALHKRGYRKTSLEAPMRETLAAAIVRIASWDGSMPLHDPFCGSGTLVAEALMRYCRIPAGHFRTQFGFQRLPDYDAELWTRTRAAIDGEIRELPRGLLSASDISEDAVLATRENLRRLPGGEHVRVDRIDFRDIPELENRVIVSNPPYGLRLGSPEDAALLTREIGDFLKQRCKGSKAYLYFGERELLKKVGLRPTWRKPLSNGALDGRLVEYLLY